MKKFLESAASQNHPLRLLKEFLDNEEKIQSASLYNQSRMVGYVLDIGFDEITIITCDPFKVAVGGIPRNSLLIMVPDAFKQDKIEQRTLHWEMDGQWAVRKGVWKLIGSGEKGLELFNLQEDIREVRNEIKEYPVLAESLEKEHLKWVREVNIGMPLGFRTKKSM
jgi:hypothetical protein